MTNFSHHQFKTLQKFFQDCSVTTGGIPIITPLKAQYDPSDQYGENHPLFVPLTQVYFTMSAGDFLVMRSMGFAWSDQVNTHKERQKEKICNLYFFNYEIRCYRLPWLS